MIFQIHIIEMFHLFYMSVLCYNNLCAAIYGRRL